MTSRLTHLDDRLFLAVNRLAMRTPWLHGAAHAYAAYGVVLFAALLLLGIWRARRAPSAVLSAAGWTPIATLLAVALNQPLGRRFHEARPYVTYPHSLRLAPVTTDFSFPSDHAVMAGAVAAGLLLVDRRLGLSATVLALLMAGSRVYVAAHYPRDVLAGLILGAVVTTATWLLVHRPLVALTRWLRHRPGLRGAFAPRPPAR